MKLEVGELIASRFRLDQFLGEGGMGSVWAATHTITQKRYALKFLKGSGTARSELRRRFAREARAASAVQHPNVVEIHDVFELDDDTPVMVMTLHHGESLRSKLKREGRLSLEETASLLLPAVSAVGAAHAAGVVHRDIKPDNIFLEAREGKRPHVRVLDFGIAKLAAPDGSPLDTGALTGTGALLGTPVYMSPEQGFGERDIDHRTDIWALGVVLYEALSGIRPVEGENIGQVLKRLVSDGITPLEVLEPELPEELTDLVRKMLAREREDRFQDLRPVLEVLRNYTDAEVPDFGAPVSEGPSRDDAEPLVSSPAVVVDEGVSGDGKTEAVRITSNDTHGPTSISVSSPRRSYRRYAAAALLASISTAAWLMTRVNPAPKSAADTGKPPVSGPDASTRTQAPATSATVTGPAQLPEAAGAVPDVDEPAPMPPPPATASAERVANPTPKSPSPRPRTVPRPRAAPAPRPAPAPPAAAPVQAPRQRGLVDEPPF